MLITAEEILKNQAKCFIFTEKSFKSPKSKIPAINRHFIRGSAN